MYHIGSTIDLIMSNMNLLQGFGTLFLITNNTYSSKQELILKDYTRKNNFREKQKHVMLLRIPRDRLIYFAIGKQNRS